MNTLERLEHDVEQSMAELSPQLRTAAPSAALVGRIGDAMMDELLRRDTTRRTANRIVATLAAAATIALSLGLRVGSMTVDSSPQFASRQIDAWLDASVESSESLTTLVHAVLLDLPSSALDAGFDGSDGFDALEHSFQAMGELTGT